MEKKEIKMTDGERLEMLREKMIKIAMEKEGLTREESESKVDSLW